MLNCGVRFLIIALIGAGLGWTNLFTSLAETDVWLAKMLSVVFLALFAISLRFENAQEQEFVQQMQTRLNADLQYAGDTFSA